MAFDDYVWFEQDRNAKRMIEQSGFASYLQGLPLWGKIVPSMRIGDTGVGFTFEQLLGVQENNAKLPDLHNYEVKSTASKAQITLFTKNPTGPYRAVHNLVDRYGKPCQEGFVLNTNLIVGRKTAFRDTFLTLRFTGDQLEVVSDDQGVVAFWSREDIRCSSSKLQNLMLCPADNHIENDVNHFKFSSYHLYNHFKYELFEDCIRNGKVSIHFRIKGSLKKARNRGVAFRMQLQDIKQIYQNFTLWP